MTEDAAIIGSRSFSEWKRKVVHVGLGLIAFSLGVLPWWLAASIALAAIVFNAWILPHAGGGSISRRTSGTDLGIVLYPVSVFVLIVIFRDAPQIAAVGWIALAFGDGMATVIGTRVGGARIPWNPAKSVAGSLGFLAAGFLGAWMACRVIGSPDTLIPLPLIVCVAIATAAVIESLQTGIDDNLTVPFSAALTMWALTLVTQMPDPALASQQRTWLVVNAILAAAGFIARTVNWSGFIGGAFIGSAVIVFGGWQLYLVLLGFFIIGSAATKAGIRRKATMGLAQEGGGRRGFSHAFANTGAATILAFLAGTTDLGTEALWLAAVASLATAAADTTGSEIGQLIGRRPFMPLTFRRVSPGTEGAISIEGTLAGAIAALILGIFGSLMWLSRHGQGITLADTARLSATVVASAVAASWVESVVGGWNRTRSTHISNGTLNFMNTVVGATLLLVFLKLSS